MIELHPNVLAIGKVGAVWIGPLVRAYGAPVGVDEAQQHERIHRNRFLIDQFLEPGRTGRLGEIVRNELRNEVEKPDRARRLFGKYVGRRISFAVPFLDRVAARLPRQSRDGDPDDKYERQT